MLFGGAGSTRVRFGIAVVAAVAVSLFVAAPSRAAAPEPRAFPAAGKLLWPSVVVRSAPSNSARRKMTLYELRRDLRPQVVLAIGSRRIGYAAPAQARLVLKNAAGADAVAVASRVEGEEGNEYGVGVVDGVGTDEFVVYVGFNELIRFSYAESDIAGLVAQVNASAAPVRLTGLNGAAPLAARIPSPLAGGRDEKPGTLWYRLNLPIRPHGQKGWVPALSVSVRTTTKRVVVNRSQKTLTVFRGNRRIFRTRVAVGRLDRQTPRGNFYVAAKYVPPLNALVSAYALELSAPAGLPDFALGGVVGIHGTPATNTLGRYASNGCIRVASSAALRLKRIVPLGTPVQVVG